ncbi:WhiB family transcriptional regulator [Nocardia amamiensis]|uniref:WhiB family transcriptional regulator n=1 Tax=Nocardia amamiensis TaxID=404578 RepID=A0ABS0CNY3_9NOCA|nr:WhiB family transcriptional regulator [Nocardia amamiensis]MBF6298275.1 WhiB family transcriptional regulator [Nocardia amamiensis]
MNRREFLTAALCRPNMAAYFPTVPIGPARDQAAEAALTQCRDRCPVRAECARDALQREVTHGLVAGVDLGPGPEPMPGALAVLRRIATF